jgi:hypothetical protein
MTDPNKLTPTELHAVQSLLNAVKDERWEEARWWNQRVEVMNALAKMRRQAAKEAS